MARKALIALAVLLAFVAGGAGLIRFAGGGATEFRVDGAEVFIQGPISGAAAHRIEILLDENPDLEVAVLGDIPGGDDVGWLIQMANQITAHNLATRVEGDLGNDAILLFLAGDVRTHVAGDFIVTGATEAARRGWPFDASPAGRSERESYIVDILGDDRFAVFMQERAGLGGTHVLAADEWRSFGLVTGN